MRPLKVFAKTTAAVLLLAVATISTSANAGYVGGGFGAFFGVGPNNNGWGMNPQQNVGFPGWTPPVGFGMNPQQNFLLLPSGQVGWGMSPQQDFGYYPFGAQWGTSPQQNIGVGNPIPYLGINAQQNVGFPGPPVSFGMNPQQNLLLLPSGQVGWGMSPQQDFGYYPNGAQWGTSPQQNVGWNPYPFLGMNPHQNVGILWIAPLLGVNQQQNAGIVAPFVGVNPNASYPVTPQMPYQSQGGVQPVQCSINTVAALTKSVDDCEKAGGDVPSSKTADASKK